MLTGSDAESFARSGSKKGDTSYDNNHGVIVANRDKVYVVPVVMHLITRQDEARCG
jgi:hypothetical protein